MCFLLTFFRGQTPAQAEINYLNKAKWLEMYGVDMHMVKVSDTSFCAVYTHIKQEVPLMKDRKRKECASQH